jgi:hypothetical protein
MTMCYVVLIASLNSQDKAIYDISSCINRWELKYLGATCWKGRGPKEDLWFWEVSGRVEELRSVVLGGERSKRGTGRRWTQRRSVVLVGER